MYGMSYRVATVYAYLLDTVQDICVYALHNYSLYTCNMCMILHVSQLDLCFMFRVYPKYRLSQHPGRELRTEQPSWVKIDLIRSVSTDDFSFTNED